MQHTGLNVAVVGTGYVGLSTAVLLAFLGNRVTGLDIDEDKVEMLKRGELPIHEPGLAALMRECQANLEWTTDYARAIPEADVIFICVGTPPLPSGRPDLQYIAQAAKAIAGHLDDRPQVVVNKSTVPVGTGDWVTRIIEDHAPRSAQNYCVVSNPEFLREGSALHDSLYPDRLVLGSASEIGVSLLLKLYTPLTLQSFVPPAGTPPPAQYSGPELVITSLSSAEMIKYAANAFLALKISFANEIAGLCERVDADIEEVARGIGSDRRIGRQFLSAGSGWGGSCFGKDTSALISTGEEYGYQMPILRAAIEVNARQRRLVIDKLQQRLHRLKGKRVALLGMAFKPNTDDLRDAPAHDCILRLGELGATVIVHDPVAMNRAREEWAYLDYIEASSVQEALTGADAAIIITEWAEYSSLDWENLVQQMRHPLIIDMRNVIRTPLLGVTVEQVGRQLRQAAAHVTL